MFAVSTSMLSTMTSLPQASTLGYLLLTLSVIALWCSSHRYLLLYLMGGMAYGLIVEIIQSGLVHTLGLGNWHGYIAALALTWAVGAWFIYRHQRSEQCSAYHHTHTEQTEQAREDYYIEHTPIYTNYRPRFPH